MKNFSKDNHHNLITLASNLGSKLSDLASQLEHLLVSASHMRYPDLWPRPTVPRDHYDVNKARKAVQLAKEIVDIVATTIRNHQSNDC